MNDDAATAVLGKKTTQHFSDDMDRKFCIAVLVIGLIALSSVAEGNPAAR